VNPSSHGAAETASETAAETGGATAVPAVPAVPVEAAVPSPAAGMDTRLDQLVARLPQLRELPLADHPGFYETVHTELQAALADIEGS
jgi:hypothetical protein